MAAASAPAAGGAGLRAPATVMRLARMGAAFPSRLSFARRLLRKLAALDAHVERSRWRIDADGYGNACYRVTLGEHTYTLVCFTRPLAPEERTDRVIAEAWDAAFVLYDGEPDEAALARLAASVPHQEAGRFTAADLVLSRANKSVRMFEHVVEALAVGRQPDAAMVRDIGYLMRTTAVYGNGKFGLADRAHIAPRTLLGAPFQAELLAVYLIRDFTHDLVEHIARARGGERAAPLAPALRRHLGVGNATGLGMAPFLVAHPVLLDRWVQARETALARVLAVRSPDAPSRARFQRLGVEARAHLAEWRVDDERYTYRIEQLRGELETVLAHCTAAALAAPLPWRRLASLTARMSLDTQEFVNALLINTHPERVDELAEQMATDEPARLAPAMPVAALRECTQAAFGWAGGIDFELTDNQYQFWYVSEEKLEPRLGVRAAEPGAALEMPLALAREAAALATALAAADADQSTAAFLAAHPRHRHIVRRVQTAARHPYAEIHDNLIGRGCLPIDMLRFKLAFFGASKFDPRSDRWTRITLFQGAPTAGELCTGADDDWAYPALAGI